MEILSTENKIQALQTFNRLQGKAIVELAERSYFYNRHAELIAALNVFAHQHRAQIAIEPLINWPAPWLHLIVDIEDMQTVGRKLKQFFDGLPLGITSINQSLSNFVYQGPLHTPEKPLQLTVQIDGR